jgi:putative oxygen-independent coproporphyrinogen III oxidase
MSLGLYIHFPWCVKKCPYCDFNSHRQPEILPKAAYIQALIQDFRRDYALVKGRKITSIFMGGGTPSLFHAEDLAPLFAEIYPYCDSNIEITLEANPGTIEHGQFADYFALGINRISLGVQSFNPEHLKKLGRIHHQADIFTSVAEIKAAGFKNFNLDLMHGLPNQSVTEALDDLRQAIDLEPTHLSWYQLTIEPNTYFANLPPTLPSDASLGEIEEHGLKVLAAAGFQRYEISAFARNQQQSQHNLTYWNFGDYMGIGAGAHGKISLNMPDQIIRTIKPKLPKTYLQKQTCTQLLIPQSALPFEFMMNALRLTQGISTDVFTAQTSLPLSVIQIQLEQAIQAKLLNANLQWIQASNLGYRFLNDLLTCFMPN